MKVFASFFRKQARGDGGAAARNTKTSFFGKKDQKTFIQFLATPILLLPAPPCSPLWWSIPLAVLIWVSFAPDGTDAPLSLDSYQRMFETRSTFVSRSKRWSPPVSPRFSRRRSPGRRPGCWSRLAARDAELILLAIIIPYLTSYLLLIYSIFVVLGPGSPIMARCCGSWVSPHPAPRILYTQTATVVMLVYENLPLMIFVLFSGMQRVGRQPARRRRSLGAGRWRRMRYIVFPLAAPALVSALIMVFVPMGGASWNPRSSAARTACCSAMSSPTR